MFEIVNLVKAPEPKVDIPTTLSYLDRIREGNKKLLDERFSKKYRLLIIPTIKLVKGITEGLIKDNDEVVIVEILNYAIKCKIIRNGYYFITQFENLEEIKL